MAKNKKPGEPASPEKSAEPVEAGQAAETLPESAEPSAVKEPAEGELEATLTNLGEAVAREAGSYDLSEQAHTSAIERAEQAASDWEMHCASLVWDVRDFLLDQIKRRPKPWTGSSPSEQRDVVAACEHAAKEMVRKIAEALASGGQPTVRVLLGQITLGDDIKIAGKVKVMGDEDEDEAVLFLHRAQGHFVMMTLASKDAHQQNERPAAGVPEEEPAFEFEAGDDEIPADDRDLVEAAVADTEIITKNPDEDSLGTGDLITLDEYATPIRVRINVQTGMVEGQSPLQEDWNIDVREATPDELAAERERTADFEPEREPEIVAS